MKSTRRPVQSKKNSGISPTWWIVGLIAVIVGIGLIAVVGLPAAGRNAAQSSTTKVLGDANAPITLEEYADFQCPACGSFARGTIKQIEDKYVANGTVKIVFRHFAFIGEESIRAAEASECANEQGKFWEMYDTLFANQGGENVGDFADDKLSGLAQGLGLDMAAFSTCFSSGKYRALVQSETANGQLRGVSSTPTSFLNDKKVIGAISMQQFETSIGPLLPK
ncbi:MAG: DsbA family protein [Thermoflexales bacterium]|nr:DsbA family protein [Thermoflexales bacterium]